MSEEIKELYQNRALESDKAVRDGDDNHVIGLLMLRQSVVSKTADDNPQKPVYIAARDSAYAELRWRFTQRTSALQAFVDAQPSDGASCLFCGQTVYLTVGHEEHLSECEMVAAKKAIDIAKGVGGGNHSLASRD
jgi:hypothetical protein